MADFRTSIDYALNYGQQDPFFELMRRRLRDQIAAQMQGAQRSGLAALDARGIGQSTAAGQTLGSIAGQGLQGFGAGMGQIAGEQAQERFQLIRDAMKAERDKRTVWDAILGLAQTGGQAAGAAVGASAGGAAPLSAGVPMEGQGAGDIWTSGAPADMVPKDISSNFSDLIRRRRRRLNQTPAWEWQG